MHQAMKVKIMSGKKEKLKKSKPAENCTFLPPRVSDDGAVRLPAVKLIYLPFGIMVDKFVLRDIIV